MVNAMNAVAPSEAMMAVSVRISRNRSIIKMAMVARLHWRMYLRMFCLNFLSSSRTGFL